MSPHSVIHATLSGHGESVGGNYQSHRSFDSFREEKKQRKRNRVSEHNNKSGVGGVGGVCGTIFEQQRQRGVTWLKIFCSKSHQSSPIEKRDDGPRQAFANVPPDLIARLQPLSLCLHNANRDEAPLTAVVTFDPLNKTARRCGDFEGVSASAPRQRNK